MIPKKYIFVTNDFMPTPGATGVCVYQLAKNLVEKGEDVTVICYDDGLSVPKIDGIKVSTVERPFFLKKYRANNEFCNSILRYIVRLIKLVYLYKYPLRSQLLVRRYLKQIKSHVDTSKQMYIIASYTPLEGVLAVAKYKKSHTSVRTIYYSTDTLSNEQGESGIISAQKREKYGYKWEKYLFNIYDVVILMECHKEHYQRDIYKKFFSKFRYASFPLIIKPKEVESSIPKSNNIKKKIVFAGTLYKKMRNPSYICELLTSCFNSTKMEVSFFGGGDCIGELESFCNKSNGLIQYEGFKPYKDIEHALADADFLLSIGNSNSTMCPSKIYEYMSTGKPIIHVYTYEADPCIEPLNRYGNALLLKEHDNDNKEILVTFVNSAKTIPFAEVNSIFVTSTPDYSVKLLEI